MVPATGERLRRFVGDKVIFQLRGRHPGFANHFRALLRTNLGRAAARRDEIIAAHAGQAVVANSSWRDVPMQKTAAAGRSNCRSPKSAISRPRPICLMEKLAALAGRPGHGDFRPPGFRAHGEHDLLRLHPAVRRDKKFPATADEKLESQSKSLEARGYATLPPSGKFRDVAKQLPHIVHRLGCRIIHLLPVHPTPTTYARLVALAVLTPRWI